MAPGHVWLPERCYLLSVSEASCDLKGKRGLWAAGSLMLGRRRSVLCAQGVAGDTGGRTRHGLLPRICTLLCCWTSLTKHEPKDTTMKNFKETAEP